MKLGELYVSNITKVTISGMLTGSLQSPGWIGSIAEIPSENCQASTLHSAPPTSIHRAPLASFRPLLKELGCIQAFHRDHKGRVSLPL